MEQETRFESPDELYSFVAEWKPTKEAKDDPILLEGTIEILDPQIGGRVVNYQNGVLDRCGLLGSHTIGLYKVSTPELTAEEDGLLADDTLYIIAKRVKDTELDTPITSVQGYCLAPQDIKHIIFSNTGKPWIEEIAQYSKDSVVTTSQPLVKLVEPKGLQVTVNQASKEAPESSPNGYSWKRLD